MFFHFTAKSAALASSDFDSFLYLFAFVKEKPSIVTVFPFSIYSGNKGD